MTAMKIRQLIKLIRKRGEELLSRRRKVAPKVNVAPQAPEVAETSDAEEHTVRVFIPRNELEEMGKVISSSIDREIGGNLFGYRTDDGDVVILYVLGAGLKSDRGATHFVQDADYLEYHALKLKEEFGLRQVGVWHSHYTLGLDHPSGGDVRSMCDGMETDGLENYLLVIGTLDGGTPNANPFLFIAGNTHFTKLPWNVTDDDSPVRRAYDGQHWDFLNLPNDSCDSIPEWRDNMIRCESLPPVPSADSGLEWLDDKQNRLYLKEIIDEVNRAGCTEVRLLKTSEGIVKLTFRCGTSYFEFRPGKDFPAEAPEMIKRIKTISYERK